MTTKEIISVARSHMQDPGVAMRSSAQLCLDDAVAFAASNEAAARRRALKSLAYTVGIMHADYRKVSAWVE